MRRYLMLVAIGLTMLALPQRGMTLEVMDYLILEDIAAYKLHRESRAFPDRKLRPITPYKTYKGSAGVVGGTGHFAYDHDDMTYETGYENSTLEMGVEVQVTQHASGDSDRWLLHEVEDSYRSGKIERMGLLTQGARLREINGNKFISLRGSGYSWVSNNVVVNIDYTDLLGNKPEPLEIIQAYLAKFSSTIAVTPVDFKSNAYNEKWIKDEMERRLWLCDKWNLQFQAGKVTQTVLLENLVKSMKVFLNYRQKYYGVTAIDDIIALDDYLRDNDATAIMNKLTAYKAWWTANKGNAINL